MENRPLKVLYTYFADLSHMLHCACHDLRVLNNVEILTDTTYRVRVVLFDEVNTVKSNHPIHCPG